MACCGRTQRARVFGVYRAVSKAYINTMRTRLDRANAMRMRQAVVEGSLACLRDWGGIAVERLSRHIVSTAARSCPAVGVVAAARIDGGVVTSARSDREDVRRVE